MSVYAPKAIDLYEIDKRKNDKPYYMAIMNFFRKYAGNTSKDIAEIEDLLYGVIKNSEYKWILNPYNATDERFRKYPGDLKNMDIIMPIVRKFIGEYIKSTNTFTVISKLPNEDNEFLDSLNEYMLTQLDRKAKAMLNETLNEVNQEDNPINELDKNINLEQEAKEFELRWKDQRAIVDQELLDFLKYSTDDEYAYLKAYTYWIIYGQYFVDRYIHNDDLIKEVLHPSQVFLIYSNADFVDEYDGAIIKKWMTLSEILSAFNDKLTNKDKKYLKDIHTRFNETGQTQVDTQLLLTYYSAELGNNMPEQRKDVLNKKGHFSVDKLYFKAFKEIKILTYTDILGKEQQMEVERDYKLDESIGDIKLETDYIPTVYVMYAIGDIYTGVYIPPEEIPVQRNKINNNYACKLPITGKINLMPLFPNHSIPLTLKYYQKVINILYLARERAIAKNHGKIAVFPKGLLGGDDIEQEEQLYRMTSSGIAFPDDSVSNFAVAVQALKAIDLSDYNYIESLSRLIIETKQLANDAVDMNPQRAGEMYPTSGKYVTEQAIMRSSLGSAMINEVFNKARCKDYEADIDFTKVAWIDGKKGKYMSSNRKTKFFEINGYEHCETEYGIFVDNSLKLNDKLNKLQDLAFSASQNGQFNIAIEAIDTENLSKLKEILLHYQELEQKRAKEAQENEAQNAQTEAKGVIEAAKLKEEHEDRRNTQDNITKLKNKLIDYKMTELKENKAVSDDTDNIVKELEDTIQSLESQLETTNINV